MWRKGSKLPKSKGSLQNGQTTQIKMQKYDENRKK